MNGLRLSDAIRLRSLLLGVGNLDGVEIIRRFETQEDIYTVLYNRPPSLMLEKGVVFRENIGQETVEKVICQMTVTENHCNGHYPGYPILPLAQQAEFVGQTGALLLSVARQKEFANAIPFAVKNQEFRSGNSGPVFPGDILISVAQILRYRMGFANVDAIITIRDQLVATMEEVGYMAVKMPFLND